MFYSPKLWLRDWWIHVPLIISLVLQVLMWWYLIAHFNSSSEQVFLHYNIVFGVDLVGNWWQIFYFPAGGLFALLINYFFAWGIYSTDRLLSRFLSVLTALITLLLSVAVWLISGINI